MKSFKTVFVRLVFASFFLFSSGNVVNAQAQPVAETTDSLIRFAGIEDDMVIFEVELENLPLKGSTISILDNYGTVLFEERIAATSLNRRYKIVRNNIDTVTFKVSGKSFSINRSFTISYRLEERLEVKKVK